MKPRTARPFDPRPDFATRELTKKYHEADTHEVSVSEQPDTITLRDAALVAAASIATAIIVAKGLSRWER